MAGLTTFLTMAYVLGTIPNMMSARGMHAGAILTPMILLTIGTSVAMGLITNRPFALAPPYCLVCAGLLLDAGDGFRRRWQGGLFGR